VLPPSDRREATETSAVQGMGSSDPNAWYKVLGVFRGLGFGGKRYSILSKHILHT